jgi:hypothetical protein
MHFGVAVLRALGLRLARGGREDLSVQRSPVCTHMSMCPPRRTLRHELTWAGASPLHITRHKELHANYLASRRRVSSFRHRGAKRASVAEGVRAGRAG